MFWGAGTHVPEASYPFRTAIMFGVTLGSPTEFSRKTRVCGHAGDVRNAGTHVPEAPYPPNGDHVWCGSGDCPKSLLGHVGDVQNAGTHALEAPHPNGDHVWCGSVVFNVSIILSWSKKFKPLKTVNASPDVV